MTIMIRDSERLQDLENDLWERIDTETLTYTEVLGLLEMMKWSLRDRWHEPDEEDQK